MEAAHSRRSCPYWWSSSESRPEILTPAITTNVENTSDKEYTASDTIATELPNRPATNLPAESRTLTMMLCKEIRIAIDSRFEVRCCVLIINLLLWEAF